MFLNVLPKCFQVPVPAVWKSFILRVRSSAHSEARIREFHEPGLLGSLQQFLCADWSSPRISAIHVGHFALDNYSLRKYPQFFAKLSQQMCRILAGHFTRKSDSLHNSPQLSAKAAQNSILRSHRESLHRTSRKFLCAELDSAKFLCAEIRESLHFSISACHPCAGAMLIFSVSFQV